jgi:hypothetical protein
MSLAPIGEPAFIAESFIWCGEHPKHGGVRLRVTWNPSQVRFILFQLGGAFRCLSPCLRLDQHDRLLGTAPNVGGLVEASAFKTIAPIELEGVWG